MQIQEQLLWHQANSSLDQLEIIAKKIGQDLSKERFFCLWLVGDIGAGKTTLAGFILRSLGLSPEIPVTSPTFTYLSDYTIGERAYAHLDFYRINENSPVLRDILYNLDFDGILVEWPEMIIGENLNTILPTHILKIEKSADLLSRSYDFFKATVVP